jgi:hypothetical protein
MTDRHAGYVVTLARDIREDDAEAVIAAISMVKGVVSVKPVVADIEMHITKERRDSDWRGALYALATIGPQQG